VLTFSDLMSCPDGLQWNADLEVCDNTSCEVSAESIESISTESVEIESVEYE
jgi:hypothetical protein